MCSNKTATFTISISLLIFSLITSCQKKIALFNGKNLNGWSADVPMKDSLPGAPASFIVRDDLLVSMGEPRGHLITDEVFENYRLTVEYRFAGKPGNCGILVHVSTPRFLYKMFPKSIEIQMEHKNAGDFWVIGEDITVLDMEKYRGPKADWGTTEGKARQILNLTDNSENALGEWNRMTIECVGNSIKVWVNGDMVNYGYGATASRGKLAIQAEGSEVEFRRIELQKIDKLSD